MRFGFDLGGTKTEIAVLSQAGEMLFRHRMPTPSGSYNAVLLTMAKLLDMACDHLGVSRPEVAGVGMPGCLDTDTQRVRGANTQVLNNQLFRHDLQQILRCDVQLQNDANCLALSEAWDGAAADGKVVFAAILGTGCGGGIVVHRQLLVGKHAIAGEWGHNPLPWPSSSELEVPACWCGQQGCLETWLSGTAFAHDHARHTGLTLSAQAIVAAMRQGDAAAVLSMDRYIHRLGRALAQVVNLLDPDVIVLGGGMSNVADLYPRVGEVIAQYTFGVKAHTPVRAAMHGDSSGVRGAAWLCN